MFSERTSGLDIVFVQNYPAQNQKVSVQEGDSVTLKLGNAGVEVRDVVMIGPGRYRGSVLGFEPGLGMEYEGLKVGQQIEFEHKHIFGCREAYQRRVN